MLYMITFYKLHIIQSLLLSLKGSIGNDTLDQVGKE